MKNWMCVNYMIWTPGGNVPDGIDCSLGCKIFNALPFPFNHIVLWFRPYTRVKPLWNLLYIIWLRCYFWSLFCGMEGLLCTSVYMAGIFLYITLILMNDFIIYWIIFLCRAHPQKSNPITFGDFWFSLNRWEICFTVLGIVSPTLDLLLFEHRTW